jgi:ornithine cyclodeaminase
LIGGCETSDHPCRRGRGAAQANPEMSVLILTASDVQRLFPMELAIEAARRGAAEYSAGRAQVPLRHHLTIDEHDGSSLVMSGYLPRLQTLGLKLVSGFRANRERNVRRADSVVLVIDPTTGWLEALLEGSYLTDVRTGAMSGIACEYLARQDSTSLGLIGSGAQARTQLDAIAAVLPIRRVRAWSRSPDRLAAFVAESAARHPQLDLAAAPSPAEACAADVVVAATTSTEPVVLEAWIRPGTLVCGVGSNRPNASELDPTLVARAARVAVDSRTGTLAVGDLAGPIAAGRLDPDDIAELGELVLGTAAGRQSDDETTIFKSVGFAAVDLTSARLILDAAREQGLGQQIDLHA